MVKSVNKLLGVLLLFITTALSAAEITATVDRNPIPTGESFQFVLKARGSIDEEPDFSELQKKFKIVNSSQSSNFQLINGSISRNKTWSMVLMADEPGSYVLPAIKFGKDKSDPIAIKIIANTIKPDNGQQAEIYLEIEVEPKSAYVQQQVIYTIKIFRRVRWSNASLSEPVSENNQAIVSKLGSDSDSKITINGVSYSVLERRYALFPQKSGKLKIPPITFETQIIRNTRQRSFFNMDPFNAQGTIKRIKSRAVEIQVKSIPVEFTKKYPDADWLPVDNLTITESWSGDTSSFKSGEPMTRTINLMAQNLTAAQLPDIKFATPKNIKLYPDVPVSAEQNNKKGLVATKQFKTALLPTKTGDHKLSEIIIPWWNTRTNTIQESRLPAKKIHVTSSSGLVEDNKLKLGSKPLQQPSDPAPLKKSSKVSSDLDEPVNSGGSYSLVWVVISLVVILLWLITIFLFMQLQSRYKFLVKSRDSKNNYKSEPIPASTKDIKNACLSNDASSCSLKIIQWANNATHSEQFTNLSSLLPYTDAQLSKEINVLVHHLYANKAPDWKGANLWAAFNLNPPGFSSEKNPTVSNQNLPSLYANYK